MYVHVQRENGLAHRTLVLAPWQVQLLRVIMSKWFLCVVGAALASWGYFAVQAARVPLLTQRISHLEQDTQRLDSLRNTLTQLQSSYEQVERMLRVPVSPRSPRADTASTRTHP